MALTAGARLGPYEILSPIGSGGMGEVYRARDTKLGREVAVKVVPDAFAQDADRMARFTREAQVLAALNHSNIAAIYGVEERALVMELVEGSTLAQLIAAGAMPIAEALPAIRQIIDALEYAHEKGIVHRDLKPANIKVTPEGRVKVLDFGLAKALANEAPAADPASSPTLTMRATMAGVILGTAAYMAPEQARGHDADKRADIWAFGVVVYEMLTGRQLFSGPTVSDTLASVLTRDPDWTQLPPDTPPAIRRLLHRCLERDRKRRLRDIGDALIEIDDPSGVSPAPAASPQVRAGFRWWNAAVALVALAGVAVAVGHFRETPPQPAPVRFQIPAPEKSDFGSYGMALSPDGRRLAFIASTDGRSMLWVRPLDALTAVPLPGTEGAVNLPFWSPDSRFIGFVAQGRVKKIEAWGGPPQTLCEGAGNLLGGSWNRDGMILFGSSTSGLYRVPQAGGVPSVQTTPESSQGEIAHMRPWFLPDGRHFLYVTRGNRQETVAIYLAALDSKQRKRLTVSRQAGAYAPPAAGSETGHLLFLREGTLMAQPLDARRLELAGEPFPVAEQVGSTLALGYFSVSANGVLAYRAGGAGGNSQLVWFNREGKSLATLGPPANYNGSLSLAKDGKHVAVDEIDQGTNRDIWVLDVARGVPTRFTFEGAQDANPVWLPDGARLVFASDRGASGSFDVYQKDAGGAGAEKLLQNNGRPEDVSPDGRYLLYAVSDPKTGIDLWVLPLAGAPGERKPVPYLQTQFAERQGQFSPDGRWIAYTSNESGADQYQVYVQSFPAGAGKFQVSTGAGGTQPRWRRDGKEIFYVAADGKLMAVDVTTAPNFQAGTPKALFDPRISLGGPPAYTYFRYDVTADGKRFLANSAAGAQGSPVSTPITVVLNWQAALKR